MFSNKQIFITHKVHEKESTGDNSFQNNGDKEFISSKNLFQDFKLLSKNNDSFGFDIFGESNESYDSIKLFSTNNDDENSFQKNRNNFNNNLINDKENNYEENRSKRCDSLLIKFKAFLGKWFITQINEKLLDLRKKSILKRAIKFYAFNYKKFTIKVSYEQNKHWLMSKLEELLLLGDEENQIKKMKKV